ncbi:dihydrolipoyl dehydrogenase [Thiolapillus brandeum]|uniref:Dihydrolipoyl dehydrogenase n=1 Tax=Thiolapillus brandeum TaxID=1076588 RepID=A0A7U6GHY3_9GAMM|nr:dihydrolipoyl dehydrogenase [Thiolapillus brandeum]BAO43984.1 dihydrolipoamide dehydrogenase [Thiolapillus brandeum]
MSNTIEVTLPDIGDFPEVEVIEVLVKPGDTIEKEDSIITLESDKASMEIPSPESGVVKEVRVSVGDRISQGSPLLLLETGNAGGQAAASETEKTTPKPAPVSEKAPPVRHADSAPVAAVEGVADIRTQVLVLGAGPGGYSAAFRAADLGMSVVLVEKYADLGGVCLNVGCIPSKALLHTVDIINEAAELEAMGVSFGKPSVDLDKLRAGKDRVVKKLTGGLAQMARMRKVQIVRGWGQFQSPKTLSVEAEGQQTLIEFDHCIIACGSSAVQIPGFPNDDPRLIDSTGALALEDIPRRMLIIGGGIIGLEMATVYSTLGSRVDIVELQDGLIPGCDRDLVKPLQKRLDKQVNRILLKTSVESIKALKSGLKVSFAGDNAPEDTTYDKVLVAVGRRPNGHQINAAAAGVEVDQRGFIAVDQHMRTNVPHIFAIGDVVGNPMLAHKATHEAHVAAEVIAGLPAMFDPLTIPSVAYTDPEVAWMGLTETEAKEKGIRYEKSVFPWAASGRAIGVGRDEGMTKLLFDPDTRRILGAGIVGVNAGELIGETVLALEMGADAEDIGLTIHPHPTLNESIGLAAEAAEGSCTDLPPQRRK